jgi:ABC-2 type transport system ATP-binding protein
MSDTAVEIDGLRKAFGTVLALDGLSFLVPSGSVLGLLGPDGSGKTTTVSILSTALRPDAGRATIGGLDAVADAARVRRVTGWLQAFGTHQPVNALVAAERALILGGPAARDVLVSLAWSGGILLVFGLLAARSYARMGR